MAAAPGACMSPPMPFAPEPMFCSRLPSADFQPRIYDPGGGGNWSGHLPFARDLVEWLRPKCLVELGVEYGESYFGLCQSIQEAGLDCRAWAVDTWLGDLLTGGYGEEVYEQVRQHNRMHYESFSTLLRMTFDEASRCFEPQSIDLLHIDGLHTYDAVRHDFETWRPLLAPGAVVLFHDIAVRKGNFGVWRFWEELSAQYPAFSFTHSNGLGVLLSSPPEPAHPFAKRLFCGEELPGLRAYYEICAERMRLRYDLQALTAGRTSFNLQLFWRSAEEPFAEERSRRTHVVALPEETEIQLPAPPKEASVAQIRLDISDRPALLLLRRLALVNRQGEPVWEMPVDRLPEDAVYAGMRFAVTGHGLLIHIFDSDSAFVPSLPADVLARFTDGGRLSVSLCAANAFQALGEALDQIDILSKSLKAARQASPAG